MTLTLMALIDDSHAGSNITTVGSDVACQFKIGSNKINDALNDPNNYDEIRITNGEIYEEYLDLSDRDVVIKGGYSNCTDAANDISGPYWEQTHIRAPQPSIQPVIVITGSANRNQVRLENLMISGGTNSTFESAGGLNVAAADLELTMVNVQFHDNAGRFGGGMSVFNGDTDVSGINVYFKENTATLGGGGLNCSGANNTVLLYNDSNFDLNFPIDFGNFYDNEVTNGDGGGALITDGCMLNFYGGTDDISGSVDRRGFWFNSATDNGGGIAITNGGTVNLIGHEVCNPECIGDNEHPVFFYRNQSDFDQNLTGAGGGVFVDGPSSSVNIYNAHFYGNFGSFGGALSVINEGQVAIKSVYEIDNQFVPCWQQGSCTLFEENFARVSGGVFQAIDVGQLQISNAIITRSSAPYASVMDAYNNMMGLNNEIEVLGSLVYQNGTNILLNVVDVNLFSAIDGVSLNMLHSTVADNDLDNSVFTNSDASITLRSSIVNEDSSIVVMDLINGTNVGGEYNCLITHELTSLPGNIDSLATDPQFNDPINADFELNPNLSTGIDYCSDLAGLGSGSRDLLGQIRGWDDMVASNTHGIFDVGAYESYENDIIFESDFDL